jgi:hypothetical protein
LALNQRFVTVEGAVKWIRDVGAWDFIGKVPEEILSSIPIDNPPE